MAMVNKAHVSVATGDALDVRSFHVTQAMSRLFRIEVEAVSRNPDIDFDAIIGLPAELSLTTAHASPSWSGLCVEMDQLRVDPGNLATYTLVLAPQAYLLTQRKNYRIFQYMSELEIVRQILGEWGVPHEARVDEAAHIARKFRVQYGESDFDFVCRMLEDAGISFHFGGSGEGTTMVLDDEPHERDAEAPPLTFQDRPGTTSGTFATQLSLTQRTRPGKATIGDLEYRRASTQQPLLSAKGGLEQESALEQFHYEPGAFLYVAPAGGNTPAADDRGTARTDESSGARKANDRLLGARQDATRITFESNVISIAPGTILSITDHPHATVTESPLLATSASIAGDHDDD